MALTKPAGVALQVVGLILVIIGGGSLVRDGNILAALFFLPLGGALLWVGRKPAVTK